MTRSIPAFGFSRIRSGFLPASPVSIAPYFVYDASYPSIRGRATAQPSHQRTFDMHLQEILTDPSLLFDFIVPIHRAEIQASELNSGNWSLAPLHKLPKLAAVSDADLFADASLAWNDHGLFAQFDVAFPKASKSPPASIVCNLYLDTRGSLGIHRANSFCHRFYCLVELPRKTEAAKRIIGHGELRTIDRAKESPTAIHPKDISVVASADTQGYSMRITLRGDTLTGFHPSEFPEIGIFYELMDAQYGYQSMARSSYATYINDPSLWCRGRLVSPEASTR